MRKLEDSAIVALSDVEDDVSASPFLLVVNEAELTINDVPNDLATWDQLHRLVQAVVEVFEPITPLRAELIGFSLYGFAPPSSRINDGVEDGYRRLVDGNGRREIGCRHGSSPR